MNGIPIAIVECKSPTLGEGWTGEAVDPDYEKWRARLRELGSALVW